MENNQSPKIFDFNKEKNEIENKKDFWNAQHVKPVEKSHWVSGTTLEEICGSLNIPMEKLNNKTVLEIGIGHGICTKSLHKICNNYALDISEEILKKVKDDIIEGYTPDQLNNIPENFFDFVISHLVAQHISTPDLENQIKRIIQCIKPDGIFAMQIADVIDGEKYLEETIENIVTGGICKPIGSINKMVIDGGGYLNWISSPRYFFPDNKFSKWYFIHIKRIQ
jgi:2-polyprenyl-3-methyl-5-hydroxy-6-metoxy-1,4-benzoquinol methylase